MALAKYLQYIKEDKQDKLNWNIKYYLKNYEELDEDE